MRKKTIDLILLQKAQGGHKESLCVLATQARREMYVYLLRLTLDDHISEDLCQETIVQMLKSLPKLRIPTVKAFWAWMYKTAFSTVSRQFRDQGGNRVRNRTTSDDRLLHQIQASEPSGSQVLMHKELTAAVWEAMDSVKLRYRHILTLRCFQDLSYAEIASITGGTELQARLQFFRAKQSLRRQLASRGFRSKSQLLPALTLFGALTAGLSKTASAGTMVKVTSLQVSAGATALGIATSKVGVATVVIASVLLVGGATSISAFMSHPNAPHAVPQKIKNLDTTLLDRLQSSDFQRPSSLGKTKKSVRPGLFWTDHARKGKPQPNADVRELLVTREEQDLRAVLLPQDRRIDFWFPSPIIDRPGADIVLAGWSAPPPVLEVHGPEKQVFRIAKPTVLHDSWNRRLFGYDLSQLPTPLTTRRLRVIGAAGQRPQQGFELHEIRARIE